MNKVLYHSFTKQCSQWNSTLALCFSAATFWPGVHRIALYSPHSFDSFHTLFLCLPGHGTLTPACLLRIKVLYWVTCNVPNRLGFITIGTLNQTQIRNLDSTDGHASLCA